MSEAVARRFEETADTSLSGKDTIQSLDIPLAPQSFMLSVIRELAGTLENVVGVEDAKGFVNHVGGQIGDEIDALYGNALRVENLTRDEVSRVLIDLKRRINGDFYVVSEDEGKIVLGNRRCPFGKSVEGHPSLCMMTSNVFGKIVANNLGYGRVDLNETIANGDGRCLVTIHLTPSDEVHDTAREYFGI